MPVKTDPLHYKNKILKTGLDLIPRSLSALLSFHVITCSCLHSLYPPPPSPIIILETQCSGGGGAVDKTANSDTVASKLHDVS